VSDFLHFSLGKYYSSIFYFRAPEIRALDDDEKTQRTQRRKKRLRPGEKHRRRCIADPMSRASSGRRKPGGGIPSRPVCRPAGPFHLPSDSARWNRPQPGRMGAFRRQPRCPRGRCLRHVIHGELPDYSGTWNDDQPGRAYADDTKRHRHSFEPLLAAGL